MKKLVRKIIHLEKPSIVEAEYVYEYEEEQQKKNKDSGFRIEGEK